MRKHLYKHSINIKEIEKDVQTREDQKQENQQVNISSLCKKKKQTIEELIARLAAEDLISFRRIAESSVIRNGLLAQGHLPPASATTVLKHVMEYGKDQF